MPHVLFYECGSAPTTRSVRQLTELRRAGWAVTVVHLPGKRAEVEARGFRSVELPEPEPNIFMRRLADDETLLSARLKQLKNVRRFRVNRRPDEAAAVQARLRAVQAARRNPTPLTEGSGFGDLTRMELWWQDAARELASVPADVLWAADLDALPPVVWAAQAMSPRRPVVFDSHEFFCGLHYLPEVFSGAWRALANRFIPQADLVVTVSREIAAALEREHGARSPLVIHNLAMAGPSPEKGLRDVLQLDPALPLVVHIGMVSQGRHPGYVIHLLADRPDVHVAFVGVAEPALKEQVQVEAARRGVGSRLHFVDPVPLENLVGFLRGTDASVIIYDPNYSRNYVLTMPNKLFDSLAAGIPVVTTQGTATADFVVREGVGKVFAFDEPAQFAHTITEVLDDRQLRSSVENRAHEFLFTQVADELDRTLRALIGSGQ